MLAVAALSARALVESAALDGTRTVALDCFGDADTQRLAVQWHAVGAASALRIDDDRLLEALRSRGVTLDQLAKALEARQGKSGIAEKASRGS